jgi:peroxiredoxin
MRYVLFSFYLLPIFANATSFFKLKGEVKNPTENKIIVTLYKNWVEDPEDYTLFLDDNNRFAFETSLSEIAYLDINYGLNGILFQIIEPGDEIYLKFDTNDFYGTFFPTGVGSAKWMYYLNHRKKFEAEVDTERAIYGYLKKPFKEYNKALEKLKTEQLEFLDGFKEYFSEDFFRLRRADILGKMGEYKLDYLVSNGKLDQVFKQFELKTIDPNLQDKSFYYGYFIESLVDTYRNNRAIGELEGILNEYTDIKYAFSEDLIGKPIAERLLANKINASLDLEGYTSQTESVLRDFNEFAKNEQYKNYLTKKLAIIKGKSLGEPAPSFVLSATDDSFMALKDFKGKYLLIVYWASWCQLCLNDLAYLPIISNYFKEDKNLSILTVASDTPNDFRAVKANALSSSKFSARVDPNSKFLKDYGITTIPSYILLDKDGNWSRSDLVEPALDEGRALIKQLEKILRK